MFSGLDCHSKKAQFTEHTRFKLQPFVFPHYEVIPMQLLLVNRQNFLKLGSILYHTHTALLYITPFTFPTHRFPHVDDTYFITFPSNFTLYQCIPKMNVLLLLTFKLDINGVCKYTPLKLTFFTQ